MSVYLHALLTNAVTACIYMCLVAVIYLNVARMYKANLLCAQ